MARTRRQGWGSQVFRGLRRSIGRVAPMATGMMGLQTQGLMGAIGQRQQAMGAPQGYIDDSMAPQSAMDPNYTLKSVQQRRRPGMMSGMGGMLGGK